jgi:hypothetical protein
MQLPQYAVLFGNMFDDAGCTILVCRNTISSRGQDGRSCLLITQWPSSGCGTSAVAEQTAGQGLESGTAA